MLARSVAVHAERELRVPTQSIGGGQGRTAWHAVFFFMKTQVCDRPAKAIGAAQEIKVLRFSNMVLEVLFPLA